MSGTALSARSVVASTLLGTVPPRLPARLLVAFAAEFGIRAGTTRTALSRMVERGELVHVAGGEYALTGALLERHHRQEVGLHPAARAWDGSWEMVVVPSGARSSRDRAALRQACAHLGLAERRDGVWLRPANLAPDRLPSAARIVEAQAERWYGRPDRDGPALVAELFDLEGWSARARTLCETLGHGSDSLADGFVLAADALRHLVVDPLLPVELAPPEWPAAEFRAAYADYSKRYQASLRTFFRAQLSALG